ncbi:serine carboxypeptidase-like 18 [Phalaenopsis equestris]|uniref:serine carboxypeptidase-like 18 n=1 Tax=Phalaenopsis equestris TaxID=78828 RepID=UPI0009E24C89|nr:serine carboxypeptidase-like 18 [Phalaenopsis equestris]
MIRECDSSEYDLWREAAGGKKKDRVYKLKPQGLELELEANIEAKLKADLDSFPQWMRGRDKTAITLEEGEAAKVFNSSLYVSLDEVTKANLFYYFVESERNPREDPLILWLTGGPDCTSVYAMCPIRFKIAPYDGILPTLVYNPYTWTNFQISNIIFLDRPAFSGFSFLRNVEKYNGDDIRSSKEIYNFLRKWFLDHPLFLSNPFYVGGNSYGGKLVPIAAYSVAEGWITFLLQDAKGNLAGQRRLMQLRQTDTYASYLAYHWANHNDTRVALHVKEGTVKEWQICEADFNYEVKLINSSIPYHHALISRGYRSLVFSGDHDLVVPFSGTMEWIDSFNLLVNEPWPSRPVAGQVGG